MKPTLGNRKEEERERARKRKEDRLQKVQDAERVRRMIAMILRPRETAVYAPAQRMACHSFTTLFKFSDGIGNVEFTFSLEFQASCLRMAAAINSPNLPLIMVANVAKAMLTVWL